MKGTAWRVYLGIGALATGAYYLLPYDPAGAVLNVVGDALFSFNDLVLGIEPFPSLADALYLPGYPVLAAGLALLTLSRSTGRDWAGAGCWPWGRPPWSPRPC